jgi:hypothetical protein
MTKGEGKAEVIELKGWLSRDEDFVRAAVEALVHAALEAEMTEAIGAEKGECSETRLSYSSGYYSRSPITRVGTLELRVPQDPMGRFSTELFERYQRSEKALVGTLAQMYGHVSPHRPSAALLCTSTAGDITFQRGRGSEPPIPLERSRSVSTRFYHAPEKWIRH